MAPSNNINFVFFLKDGLRNLLGDDSGWKILRRTNI